MARNTRQPRATDGTDPRRLRLTRRRRIATKDAQPGTVTRSTAGFLVLLANGRWATLSDTGLTGYATDAMMPLTIALWKADELPASMRAQYDALKTAGEFEVRA